MSNIQSNIFLKYLLTQIKYLFKSQLIGLKVLIQLV